VGPDPASVSTGEVVVGVSSIFFVVIVALLGGGGASALPTLEAICMLAGFGLIAVLLATGSGWRIERAAWGWVVLALAAFALPMVQLIPLPAGLGAALPGRELANAVRAEAGAGAASPWTLDPDRTVIAALSLVPAIALFCATLRCDQAWRRRIAVAWIVMAVIAVLLGALQVASAGSAGGIYDTLHRGAAMGFFANRNHNSIFLVTALVLFVILFVAPTRQWSRIDSGLRLAIAALLVVGVFITTSRAGMLLLLATLPFLFLIARPGQGLPRLGWPVLGAAGLGLGALIAFATLNPVAQRVLARFSLETDLRWAILPDVVQAIGQYWPVGTGIGTFARVFAPQERLETVDRLYVNHAHNDYLELALEGGIVAVLLMIGFVVMLAARARVLAGWQPGAARNTALASLLAISTILLHSVVDYPLRAITITTLFGFLAGLLFAPASRVAGAGEG
jgi:O-antigen ligase